MLCVTLEATSLFVHFQEGFIYQHTSSIRNWTQHKNIVQLYKTNISDDSSEYGLCPFIKSYP